MDIDILRRKLIKCKDITFDEVSLDDLEDITQINFSKKSDSREKIIDFIKSSKNPYMFKCNGKKIKIEFGNTDLIAERCLEQTINKIYK